jgi:hypothetical protein
MHALYVEVQPPATGTDIAVRLTRHLCIRQLNLLHQYQGWRGPVAVVAQDPSELLKQTQKQWTRLTHRAQTARSNTSDAHYLLAFADVITMLQCVHFTTNIQPDDEQQHNVTFATASQYSAQPPFCKVMYVTYQIPTEQLHQITAWMPRLGVVVVFGV